MWTSLRRWACCAVLVSSSAGLYVSQSAVAHSRHSIMAATNDDETTHLVAGVLLSEEGEGVGALGISHDVKEDALKLLHAAAPTEQHQLSLTLCDDSFIHGLNRQWRGVDRPTDVLSFPLDDEVLLGDLVISVDTAQREATERGYALRDEIRVLLVHGLLHLLGYDHGQFRKIRHLAVCLLAV